MPSRSDKERILKHNVEVNTERHYRSEILKRGESNNSKLKEEIRKSWEESARRVDKTKLHEVWNK
jgi:hypothetical protein